MSLKFNRIQALDLANRIRKARKARGLTLVKLGLECDTHHSQLSRMERGRISIASKNLLTICTFLQLPLPEPIEEAHERLLGRVRRLLEVSMSNERLIENLVTTLEELSGEAAQAEG
ncbi:helix-turn-helix domain-containing protein [Pseudomonas peli]|uniref:helix-turn-helix domain-containing protein n=1 Tax=Pseudomonas peli TaxID=592361 RepID=UPI00286BD7E1|nr:helix-turn-helix transcriptional regulator [Pseudomonas peli]